jgi:AcrR family transcriptional regulator
MPDDGRPVLRADARRNRAKVLLAAQEAFGTEGLAVPLDEIARRAGVGAGTVYRHFPTKEALFEAVLVDRLEQLVETARKARQETDPAAAFFAYVAHLVADAGGKKDLADALAGAGVDLRAASHEVAVEFNKEFGALLTRAQKAGAVRGDLELADLHALVMGALAAERHRSDNDRPGRMAGIVADALRPRVS